MSIYLFVIKTPSLGTGVKPGTLNTPFPLTSSLPNNKGVCRTKTLWWSGGGGISPIFGNFLKLPDPTGSTCLVGRLLWAWCWGHTVTSIVSVVTSVLEVINPPWWASATVFSAGKAQDLGLNKIRSVFYLIYLLPEWLWANIWTLLSPWAVTALGMCSYFRSLWV